MRIPRISLAAKYRILFGLAVLLIIGAALSVPWRVMESLVLQQYFREARRMADYHFRQISAHSGGAALAGDFHGGDSGLLREAEAKEPVFIALTVDLEDPDSILAQQRLDPFVAGALRRFLTRPTQMFHYKTGGTDSGRRFLYAHAVRVNRSCLACHDEGGTARPYRENQLAGVISVDLSASVSDQELMLNRAWLLAAGLLAGMLAVLVFYFITKRFILAPINELRKVAVRVADGDLDVRSSVQTGDEFEQLSDNLNTMLEKLRVSRDELLRANLALDQKLDEMAKTNVDLFESNRVKSEFLANVTHELRTPLTNIIGFAELLRESPQLDAGSKTSRYSENILISGRILLEIINDLLDLAKIEAGKVELKIEKVHVDEVCSTLIDFMRPQADTKKLSFRFEAQEGLPTIMTDRGKLRQILFNLLSNAVKFTPEAGRITLAVRREGDAHVLIEVIDSGPGVHPDEQELIFEKFRQIDGSATREHHGTGLGLAIARELTDLLNGAIGLRSEVGQGSTFWVRLPIDAPAAHERPPISLV